MFRRRAIPHLLALLAVLFFTGCASVRQTLQVDRLFAGLERDRAAGKSTYWNPRGAKGPSRIVVSLREQRAYFYKGKKLVGVSVISTGRRGFETPPGRYRVIQKSPDHASNLYGDYVDRRGRVVMANVDQRKTPAPPGTRFRGARMPYFLRFTGAYGMHAGYVPRHRASHGCIRMPGPMARRFFHEAKLGTPVLVKR